MKKYSVHVMHDAEQDLWELYSYVARNDSVTKAEVLLEHLEELCFSLEHLPERGHAPPELHRIAVSAYREAYFKSYRVIYQITDKDVYIHCVLDGQRDLEYLLMRRLLSNPH